MIVTGGRSYADRAKVYSTLDALHAEEPIAFLSHGMAPGADTLADAWATERDVMIRRYPAALPCLPQSAGPIRNEQMAIRGADLCIAFPGGAGTADMVRRAKSAGIKVMEVANGDE